MMSIKLKRYFSSFLVLVVCISLIPCAVFASDEESCGYEAAPEVPVSDSASPSGGETGENVSTAPIQNASGAGNDPGEAPLSVAEANAPSEAPASVPEKPPELSAGSTDHPVESSEDCNESPECAPDSAEISEVMTDGSGEQHAEAESVPIPENEEVSEVQSAEGSETDNEIDENPVSDPETVGDAESGEYPEEESSAETGNVSSSSSSSGKSASSDSSGSGGALSSGSGNIEAGRSETNDSGYVLAFEFEDNDGNRYDCLITGLKELDADNESGIYTLCSNIAHAFVNGESFELTDRLDYIDVELIDAEKDGLSVRDGKIATPFGDTQLCWAASAADMLVSSGWAGEATEDELLSVFTDSFFDQPSRQDYGIKWYFDGVNPMQASKKSDGNPYFYPGSPSPAAAQQRSERDFEYASDGGYVEDYAVETFLEYSDLSSDSVDELADTMIESIDDGDAVGIIASFLNPVTKRNTGNHALTVFGYIKDALKKGLDSLKALFVADSDSDMPQSRLDPEKEMNSEQTEEARSDAVNKYTMYLVSEKTDSAGRRTLRLDGYNSGKYDTVLAAVTVLEHKQDRNRETDGSGNARTAVDMVPNAVFVCDSDYSDIADSVEAGRTMKLLGSITNSSYRALKPADKPYAECSFVITKNGIVIDTVPVVIDLGALGLSACKINGTASVEAEYTFDDPGNYSVSFVIDGVYDDNGSVTEAYTSNNICRETVCFSVDGEEKDKEKSRNSKETESPDSGAVSNVKSVQTLNADYFFSELDEPLSIEIGKRYSVLELYYKGVLVPQIFYSVAYEEDGTIVLILSADYLQQLGTGRHSFRLKVAEDDFIILNVSIL